MITNSPVVEGYSIFNLLSMSANIYKSLFYVQCK